MDVIGTISSNTDDLKETVLQAGGLGLAVGAALLALRKGWSYFKSLIG